MKLLKHTVVPAVILVISLMLLAAPAGAQTLTVDPGALFCFSSEDFTTISEDDGIFIAAVPSVTVATVYYGDRALKAGDALPKEALNHLTLDTACLTRQTASIRYYTIANGAVTAAKELQLTIMPAKNEAPVAESSSFETYKNIANTGSLKAMDPEGKALTYQLVKAPKRGTVELHEDGTFTYTPNKNKVGKDSFTFTATDEAGNVSNEGKVSIKILKPTDKAAYSDMAGDPNAMWMKEEKLFTGATIGGHLCFEPEKTVSRGDFLVMLMQVVGAQAADAQMTTGFADEAATPVWMRPYLVAALANGMISGTASEDGTVFRSSADLTKAETAVLLQNVLRLPNAEAATVFAESDPGVPVWAEDAAASVAASGISLGSAGYTEAITRRDAAMILYSIHCLMEADALPTFYWED